MKRTLTAKIIAGLLTAAIAFTGISLDGTMTAYANPKDRTGVENIADLENTTVTMKIGDTKTIDFVEFLEYGATYDRTKNYEWSSSDETVVSLVNEYGASSDGSPRLEYVIIKAEKAGTATITATGKSTGTTMSCTVVVKAPEMTAKQKTCKHSFKTTKKATCLMSGMKTCKKCKLQKVIAKKSHNFVSQYETKITRETYPVYVCNGCLSTDPETHRYHEIVNPFACHDVCGEEFSTKTYGSAKAAEKAYDEHCEKYGHAMSTAYTFEYGDPEYSQIEVTRCKTCGNTPEAVEKYYN